MKLYTEEQVKNFLKERTFMTEDAIDKLCTPLIPIELPSDKEIDNYADFAFPDAEKIGKETYTAYKGFIAGAKWMKEQILNQNK